MTFYSFFLSPLSTSDSPHSLFLIPFSPHSHQSTLSQSRLASSIQQSDQPLRSNIVVISTDHDPAIQALDSVNADDSDGTMIPISLSLPLTHLTLFFSFLFHLTLINQLSLKAD